MKFDSRKAFLEANGFFNINTNQTWIIYSDHDKRTVIVGIDRDDRDENKEGNLIVGFSWEYKTDEDGSRRKVANYSKAIKCLNNHMDDGYALLAFEHWKSESLYTEPKPAKLVKKEDGWYAYSLLLPEVDYNFKELTTVSKELVSGEAYPVGQQNPKRTTNHVEVFGRDKNVVAYVLSQANDGCEYCGKSPFFKASNGEAFLEVHHMKHLANGGSDTVSNAVALCPNCHKEIHFGQNAEAITDELYSKIGRLIKE